MKNRLFSVLVILLAAGCSHTPSKVQNYDSQTGSPEFVRKVAGQGASCLDFDQRTLKGPKLCAGDDVGVAIKESEYSQSVKRYFAAKVLEIDTSANEVDSTQPISILVQFGDSKTARFTSNEIVLTNKAYCQPNLRMEVCHGEKFPTSYTKIDQVVGFSIPT